MVFKEFRQDGWPMCPRCGEDELYSSIMLYWDGEGLRPSIEDCLAGHMGCYKCGWQKSEE